MQWNSKPGLRPWSNGKPNPQFCSWVTDEMNKRRLAKLELATIPRQRPSAMLLWAWIQGSPLSPQERERAAQLWHLAESKSRQARIAAMATDANACWVRSLCADAGIAAPTDEELVDLDLVRLAIDLI